MDQVGTNDKVIIATAFIQYRQYEMHSLIQKQGKVTIQNLDISFNVITLNVCQHISWEEANLFKFQM